MATKFEDIVSGGYFVGFGGLTPEQERCKAFTAANLTQILSIRQREKYIHEVQVCCCGYGPADEDEPMEDNNFSQFQFYKPYIEELVFFDHKFDFLVKCVANGVCKIAPGFEERYTQALLQVLTFRDTTLPASPDHVLDLRTLSTPRTIAEQKRPYEEQMARLDNYIHKRNAYADEIRAELRRLEEEQYRAECARGEHKSIFGWDQQQPAEQSVLLASSSTVVRAEAQLSRDEVAALAEAALRQHAEEEAAASGDGNTATPMLAMLAEMSRRGEQP